MLRWTVGFFLVSLAIAFFGLGADVNAATLIVKFLFAAFAGVSLLSLVAGLIRDGSD